MTEIKLGIWDFGAPLLFCFSFFGGHCKIFGNLSQELQWILINLEAITSRFIAIWIAHELMSPHQIRREILLIKYCDHLREDRKNVRANILHINYISIKIYFEASVHILSNHFEMDNSLLPLKGHFLINSLVTLLYLITLRT